MDSLITVKKEQVHCVYENKPINFTFDSKFALGILSVVSVAKVILSTSLLYMGDAGFPGRFPPPAK